MPPFQLVRLHLLQDPITPMGYPRNNVFLGFRIGFCLNYDRPSHCSGITDPCCHVCRPFAINLSQEPEHLQADNMDLHVMPCHSPY